MEQIYADKLCVVTGAGSGIGRAVAVALSKHGAILALSDIDEVGLSETKELIGSTRNHIRYDRLDVADEDAIIRYGQLIKSDFGAANYLFNIAGLTRYGSFSNTPLSSFEKVMDVNFWGVVRMTKAFLPELIQTKGGVINISSIFGVVGFPGQAHYCASKFAVRGFSETIAQELIDQGVCVTSVQPGGVATNIANNAVADHLADGYKDEASMRASFDQVARTSPEKAAAIILKGAAKRKSRIMVGVDAHVVSGIQRLLPNRYKKILQRLVNLPSSS